MKLLKLYLSKFYGFFWFFRLVSNFTEYLENRENHLELIDTFDEDLAVLHRIPVFPSLLHPDVNPEMSMMASTSGIVNNFTENHGNFTENLNGVGNGQVSLLDWINSRGSSQSLESVAEGCHR